MLPFGLLAGVSANALSAGLDLTGVTTPQDGPTGFTAALASFEQAGAKRAAPDTEGGPDGAPVFLEGGEPQAEGLSGELAGLPAPAEPVQLPVTGDILVAPNAAGTGNAGQDADGQAAEQGKALPDPGVKAGASAFANLSPGARSDAGNKGSGFAGPGAGPQTAGAPLQSPEAAAAAPKHGLQAGSHVPAAAPTAGKAAREPSPDTSAPRTAGNPKLAADPGAATVDRAHHTRGLEVQALAGAEPDEGAGEAGFLKREPAATVSVENGRQRRWQTQLPEVARSPMVRPAGVENMATPSSAAPPPSVAVDGGNAAAVNAVPASTVAAELPGPAEASLPAAGKPASAGINPVPAKMSPGAAAPDVPVADESGVTDEPVIASTRPAVPVLETSSKPDVMRFQQTGPSGQAASGVPDIGVNAEAETRGGLVQAAKQTATGGQPAPEFEADLPDDGVDPGEIPAGSLQRKANGSGPPAAGTIAANGAATPPAAGSAPGSAPGVEPIAAASLDPDLAAGEDAFDSELPLIVTARPAGQGGEVLASRGADALQNPTQAQSGQVATQVAAEVARNLRNGQTRFQMRFDPPELGRVDVNLKVGRDGSVQAHLIVERPETLDMFLRDQRGLERALEAAGLNADSENLKFSLNDNGSGESAFAQDENAEGGDSYAGNAGDETDGDPVVQETLELSLQARQGGLDIKI